MSTVMDSTRMGFQERKERRQAMAEMARTHEIAQVAEHFGAVRSTVYTACKEFGVTPRHTRNHWGRRKAIADYTREHGLAAAADEFGIHLDDARSACSEFGVHTVSRTQPSTLAIIGDLCGGELSQSEIARKYSVTRQLVHTIMKRSRDAGIPVKCKVRQAKNG